MKLDYCTFSGADDGVDPSVLRQISAEHPFVEWAILGLPSSVGKPRCPSQDWIERFKPTLSNVNAALHLAGTSLIEFIDDDPKIKALSSGFSRVQLNLEFHGNPDYDPNELARRISEHPEIEFIIQNGMISKKHGLLECLSPVPNTAILFDGSAGRGQSPEIWPEPIQGKFCGYAGGLNPDNVATNLKRISRLVEPRRPIWIDMESGVRTNDQFDLDKVRRVLDIAKDYVPQPYGRRSVPIPENVYE